MNEPETSPPALDTNAEPRNVELDRLAPAVAAPRAALLAAIAAGIALAIVYAASPLTVWCAGWMAAVFAWAGRGLGARERRLVLGVLAAGVAIRVLAIVGLFVSSDHHVIGSFFWDGDGVFLKKRAIGVRNLWSGQGLASVPFSKVFYLTYGWTSYIYVLAYLQYLVGLAPYGIHLVNVGFFSTAAVMLHRLVRRAFGAGPALIGLALMLALPTLIAWSVAALKESFYLLLCALATAAALTAVRAETGSKRWLAMALFIVVVAINATVRAGATLIVVGAVGFALAVTTLVRYPLLLLPAIVAIPVAVLLAWQTPPLQARILEQLKNAATQHIGNLHTEGHGYRLLDDKLYALDSPIPTMTPDECLRFAVRALVGFVVVPLPWQAQSKSETAFLAQQAVWYVMVLAACIGVVAGLKHDVLLTMTLVGFAVIGGGVIALNSGNIGTMVRFRDTIVPFVVWLSGLGSWTIVRWAAGHASRVPLSADGFPTEAPAWR